MKRMNTKRLTVTALLAALVFLLGLTPLGLIPLGFINVTALCVPVLIGTLLLGLRVGLILGFCFGSASLMSMLGLAMSPPSALASQLLGANLPLALLMCYLPRLLVPVAAYAVDRLLSRRLSAHLSRGLASAVGSLTNTVFYLGLMLLGYRLAGLNTAPVTGLITSVALIAGPTEAAVAALLVPPIAAALVKTGLVSRAAGQEERA